MKKIVLLSILAIFMFAANAQRPVTMTADTVQGSETIYLSTPTFGSDRAMTIQALCTEVGGTTDGTMTLEGSVDGTSYVALTDISGVIEGVPNDTLTMTDGAVQSWVIEKNMYYKYRIKVVGTASDTTLITPKYIIRK